MKQQQLHFWSQQVIFNFPPERVDRYLKTDADVVQRDVRLSVASHLLLTAC